MMADQAYYTALEDTRSGEEARWHNPDSGNSGYYVPEPAYQNEEGNYCREYTQNITIDGETERAYGRACRMPDGSWQIVSSDGT